MGAARFDPSTWAAYTAAGAPKSRAELFRSGSLPADLNPAAFRGPRESRDSALNPASNAVIIGADVTGSMGIIAETLVRTGIGTAFGEMLGRARDGSGTMISDPHLMVVGIGDVDCDAAPVQMTQFEADIRIAEQLERVYVEGGGGGNDHESYDVAWYAAAMRTSIDCFEKRGRKGYLFTVGDEKTPSGLRADQIERFFGDSVQSDLSARQLLAMAERTYNVFHIVVEEGNYVRTRGAGPVRDAWRALLGQRVMMLADHTKLAEVIVSAIQMNEGTSLTAVTKSWPSATSLVVARAVGDLAPRTSGGTGRLVRF